VRGLTLFGLFPSSLFPLFRASHQMTKIKKAVLDNENYLMAISSKSFVVTADIRVTLTTLHIFDYEMRTILKSRHLISKKSIPILHFSGI